MKGLDETFVELDKKLEEGVLPSERRDILVDMALIVSIRYVANNTSSIVFDEHGIRTEPVPFVAEAEK